MGYTPSLSVECVSMCKLKLWRYDCSVLSCAWKAPRVLTGSLASTTLSSSCSTSSMFPRPRTRISRQKYRCDVTYAGVSSWSEASCFSFAGQVSQSILPSSASNRWKWHCCSFCSGSSDCVSPESLWEVLQRTISDLPPDELELVRKALKASIALETLQVFAPLAKLLGMYQIKSELENLSFMYTNSPEYEKITKRVAELLKEHERELSEMLAHLPSKQNFGGAD